MHIVENKSKQGKKIYQSVLLRESYREDGKVKKRTTANLSHCSPEEISAIKFALKNKDDLSNLVHLDDDIKLQEGLSVGAVWVLYQIAKRIGIEDALGRDFHGKLSLWQVIARVIDQGSRLSAVRLAQVHAACDILGITRGFTEDNLYENLARMADNQEEVEKRLFYTRRGKESVEIFLYDVTSVYFEGEARSNELAKRGYSRDHRGDCKQIRIGFVATRNGFPMGYEIFAGETESKYTVAFILHGV